MLHQLLETKAVRRRTPFGTALSVVLHAAVIAAAIRLTGRDAIAFNKPDEVMVRHQTPPKTEAAQKTATASPLASAPTYRGFQTVLAPVNIPVDIPTIDLAAAPTNPGDFTGTGPIGGRGDGDPDAAPSSIAIGNEPFFGFQVEKAAATLPGSPAPAYPEMLKSSGIEGEVLAQFVVDTTGRVEPGSFRVLQSSHDAFGNAVRVTLPRMRFIPAEAGGTKVRMIVQQRFAFALDR